MRLFHRPFVLFTMLIAVAGTAVAQGSFALKNGDRVVFYGDSITEQGMYTNFTETYVVTRFPKLNVRFVESGWGGDRVTGGGGGPIDLRLQRDVVAYKPTVMTIMLGMNDGGYRAFDQGLFDTYSNGYRHIVDSVRASLPGIRITVIQPSPYDDFTRAPNFEGGYNAVLVRYGQFLKDLATQDGFTVADMNGPVSEALKQAAQADATLAQKIIPDRVHPGPGGHMLMAEAILKAWNAPTTVTDVQIDAAGKRLVKADNAKVSGLSFGPAITWIETDSALPMPIDMKDPVVALAIHSSDFVDALDREPLQVVGLAPGDYTLRIDGAEAGTFSGDDLAKGINLALLPTPMAAQAAAVHGLTQKHNGLHRMRWRQIELGPLQNDTDSGVRKAQAAVLRALDSEEEQIVRKQHDAAQPVSHKFELAPKG